MSHVTPKITICETSQSTISYMQVNLNILKYEQLIIKYSKLYNPSPIEHTMLALEKNQNKVQIKNETVCTASIANKNRIGYRQ